MKRKKIQQHHKAAQMRKEFLSKFSVQRRDDIDSPNHWHWSSDAVFPLSHGNEMQEQWPSLSNIKSNVGSGTKDCDKPVSKDNESSASKDGISSESEGLDSSASKDDVNLPSAKHVSLTCEDRVGLASEHRVSSKKKDHGTSRSFVINGVEAKCDEWTPVPSKSKKGIAKPKVTDSPNLKHQMIRVYACFLILQTHLLSCILVQ